MKQMSCQCGTSRVIGYPEGTPHCVKCGHHLPDTPTSQAEAMIAKAVAAKVSEQDIQLASESVKALAESIAHHLVPALTQVIVEVQGNTQPVTAPRRQWASTAEVAAALGRGTDYVRDHAEELGGWKPSKRPRAQWRFPVTLIEGDAA